MKILHTADWHVGKTLRRRPRLEETANVLNGLIGIAAEEQVDLVLVCGDVFDQFAPSAEAERVVYQTLLGLRDTGSAVLVIPGNHDNSKRFAAIEQLSDAAGIQMVPEVRRPQAGGIVEITSRDGQQVAQVATLPWVSEKSLIGAEEMMGLEEDPNKAYAEELPRLLAALCSQFEPGKVHLLAAHVFVGGARIGGGERELTVGDLFAIAPQSLPSTPQYIALGHVHRPQEVPAAAVPARYSGSLLQLDFGEREQEKSVTVVTVAPGKPAKAKTVLLSGGRQLLDIEGTLDELREMSVDPDAFLRVTLRCDGPAPGLAEDVREILPAALEVRLDYPRAEGAREPGEQQRLKPRELFERYYRERHGADVTQSVIDLFDELFEEVTGEALKLAIEGFTAFRDRQDIDFEELELFVITGPTGAGKTSILDAMVFALYGQVPRLGGKQGTADLVSLGTAQARVMFEFSIKGKGRYRVARRLSRRSAQTATLERLDGEEWVSACERDGVRECERALGELLGLEFASFCKAVVLPQGEFHRFLKGESAERRKVLVSLLGVSYFERMGAIARGRQSNLSSKVERTEEIVLAQYAQATAEQVADMHTAYIQAADRSSKLTASLADAENCAVQREVQTRRVEELQTQVSKLEGIATTTRATIDRCRTVEETTGQATKSLKQAAGEYEAGQRLLADANTALSLLEAEVGTLEAIAQAAAAAQTLGTASTEEATSKTKLKEAQGAHMAVEKELSDAKLEEDKHQPALKEAADAESTSTTALDQANKRAQTLEQLTKDARRANEELVTATEQLRATTAAAESAGAEARQLDASLEHAVTHLQQYRRTNAVAELSHGLAAGDPCPVCGVALAAPPVVGGDVVDALMSARKAEQSARTAAEGARAATARAEAGVEGAENLLLERKKNATEALQGHKNLAALEGEANAAAIAAAQAGTELKAATKHREAAERDGKRAHDRTLEAQVQLQGLTAMTQAASTALEEVRNRKQQAGATVAAKFGGEIPGDAAQQIATQRERLLSASSASEHARSELDTRTEARETARSALREAEQQLAELDIELTRLQTLAVTSARSVSAQLKDGEALAAPPEGTGPRDARATVLVDWCDGATATILRAHEDAEKTRDACEEQIMRITAEYDGDEPDADRALGELRKHERNARDAASKAQSAEDEAKRRLAEREEMEAAIKAERAQIAVLADLVLELRGDRFGEYIITETLQLLAAHASKELLRISDRRYSLVTDEGDFAVIDHANADERRSVKTLSGGETFLASLALALALSRHVGDLASEGLGAKLEAVFIDEGFGTLDPETLDDVIDALERLRADDLMVGVISHVPEMAQRVRSGLEVQKEEGRSKVVASIGA